MLSADYENAGMNTECPNCGFAFEIPRRTATPKAKGWFRSKFSFPKFDFRKTKTEVPFDLPKKSVLALQIGSVCLFLVGIFMMLDGLTGDADGSAIRQTVIVIQWGSGAIVTALSIIIARSRECR